MDFRLTLGKAGILGGFFAIQFFVIFLILGFLQPGYGHLRTSISALVAGEFGWIQTINFLSLALSFIFVGFGLGKNITRKNMNKIFGIFLIFAVFAIFLTLIPTDRLDPQVEFHFDEPSTRGKVHVFTLFGLIFSTPFMLYPVIKQMRESSQWKAFVPYTLCIFAFNFVVGLGWFYLINDNYLMEWKGLIQKILATNVLVWLAVVGYRLWRLESNLKFEEK